MPWLMSRIRDTSCHDRPQDTGQHRGVVHLDGDTAPNNRRTYNVYSRLDLLTHCRLLLLEDRNLARNRLQHRRRCPGNVATYQYATILIPWVNCKTTWNQYATILIPCCFTIKSKWVIIGLWFLGLTGTNKWNGRQWFWVNYPRGVPCCKTAHQVTAGDCRMYVTVPSEIEDGIRGVFRTTEGAEAGGLLETCWTRVVVDDGPISMPRDLWSISSTF